MAKIKYQNSLLSSILVLISFLHYGCATEIKSKKITVGSAGKIESLDPARANTLKSLQLLSSMGDTLYELDNNGKLEPKLAETLPNFSGDKLKIFIKLRENIYFHDGTHFDSHAMKFSIDRFQKIGTMNYILGKKIKSIETPSKYMMIINLNKPSSSLQGLLTSVSLTPISPTFYKKHNDKFLNDQFIGTGKYKLKRFTNELQILEPNSNYWGEMPKNDGINFVGYANTSSLFGAFTSRQIDVLMSNSIDDSQRKKLNTLSNKGKMNEGNSPPIELSFISLRTNKYPFNKKPIRLALAKSFNRQLISKKVSYGLRQPSKSLVPSILNSYQDVSWPGYNPKEAKEILISEGYCNGKVLNVPLTYRSNVSTDKLIAVSWKQDLQNTMHNCISMELNGVESTTIYKNLSEGIYAAVLLDWSGAYSDPEAYLTPLLSCKVFEKESCIKGESVFSGSFWASKKINNLFLESESSNGSKRLKSLNEIEKLASESVPYIPIWISAQKAWSQKNLSTPQFNGAGRISFGDLEFN